MAVLSVALTSISALANGGQGSLASQISRAQATITARPGTSPGTTITVGSMPWGVAILHGPAHLAYVSNNNSGSVSVISTLLRRVVATVPVGPGPNAVVAAPNGRAVYVGLDTNIAVIDTLTQRVTRYIDDPDGAFELDISPDGQRLYADSGGGPMLSVFDTRSGRLIESMNLGTDSPGALAVSRDGRTLYAGIFSKPFAVDVIDTGSFRVTARVPVALNPMDIALSPRGRELYVTNWGDFSNPNNFIPGRAVQVIDTISLQASSPIQVGLLPTALAFAPDGRHA
jgi:YVTN family beta-propeller protein